MNDLSNISLLAKLVRYNILTSTTEAGSGHPTSSLSATDLMTTLFFSGFLNYDLDNPSYVLNDRVIFSKGHAAPLLYSLYQAAGAISYDELLTLRTFDSNLEGHPTPLFKYIDVATGSLGQGLSAGIGMALGIKAYLKKVAMQREPRVWVLLGDSEMAEGQVWEAMEVAAHYRLNNLVAVLDVNRLGQRGETMLGWDTETYAKRAQAFGWEAVIVEDGHDLEEVNKAFEEAMAVTDQPVMIIAKTVKGKGVSFLENADNWHGKTVPKEKLEEALQELGEVDKQLRGPVQKPELLSIPAFSSSGSLRDPSYSKGDLVATREAYGAALAEICKVHPNAVALDGETSNSTYSESVKKQTPEQFYEMYIAEQNMVSAAVGLSKLGFKPYVSTFAAFFTRAFDQIRMAQYSEADIRLVGSHAGVSIGADGPSQMALEDIAMIRSILKSIILYPSDAVSAYKLFEQIYSEKGIIFMRTDREKRPVIYNSSEEFPIGGSKTLFESDSDKAVVFSSGVTLHEAIKAHDILEKQGIKIAVVDLYSIKPIDAEIINDLAEETKQVIVVEDHYPAGGIGDAVRAALTQPAAFHHLAVTKTPRSGTSEELLRYEEIDAEAIVNCVKNI